MAEISTDDVYGIRLRNARELAAEFERLADFAAKIGKQPTQVSRFMGKNPTKTIGSKIARDIEKAYSKPHGWLDRPHEIVAGSVKADAAVVTGSAAVRSKLVALLANSSEEDLLAVLEQAAPSMSDEGKQQLLSIALQYAELLLQQREE